MSIGVGDILRVVAIAAWLDGNINQNVFNVVIGGTGGPYDEDDIIADCLDWVEDMFANFTSYLSDQLDGSEIRVYIYDALDDDWDEVGADAWVWDPTVAGDELPRGVAALVNVKTSDPDVSGKKYIGGLGEGNTIAGLIGGALITQLGLFGVDWVTPFVGANSSADFVPGVWSVTNTNFYAMTGTMLIPTIAAYQRRRKRGVGI